jgi:dynein heavy chain 1
LKILIVLVLDILKLAKRFHATVSFRTDTGLQECMDQVHKYNILMKEFPIDELLSGSDFGRVKSALILIYSHINKKIKLSSYPIKRYLMLVEAISRDLNDQILKILKGKRLMHIAYEDFERLSQEWIAIFETWDDSVKEFSAFAREVSRKRNDKYLPIKVTNFHAKLQERLQFVTNFRNQHEQLHITLSRVLVGTLGDGMNALEEVVRAYEVISGVDVLDLSPDGNDGWINAEEIYNERIGKIEGFIIAILRQKLAGAKRAGEMFRVFSKFNALFIRPKIRGAIQEYQTQLIESVKEDVKKLQEKFRLQYTSSEAYHMSQVRDIPPVSGAISWAKQIERQLDMYTTHVEDVLGRGWENYAEGQKLSNEFSSFRKKLDTRVIFDKWVNDTLQRGLRIGGNIFDVVRNRSKGNQLQLIVSFDQQSITLFKEVRNLLWLGFSIPTHINNVANEAKRLYPFAVTLQETTRMYQITLDKMQRLSQETLNLVACFHKDVQTLISKGIYYKWEAFASLDHQQDSAYVSFVQDLVAKVTILQEKVANVSAMKEVIDGKIREIESCTYMYGAFEAKLAQIQERIDEMNLNGYSNFEHFVLFINSQLESALLKRLSQAVTLWHEHFTKYHHDEYDSASRKPYRKESLNFIKSAEESKASFAQDESSYAKNSSPSFNPTAIEITIRNQVMTIEPPMENARSYFYEAFQEWIGVVCNQSRIRASNYKLSASHLNAGTYVCLVNDVPDTLLATVYKVLELKFKEVEQYLESWLKYQALWDVQPTAVYDSLGDDVLKWQTVLMEIRKDRSNIDVSGTSQYFGPILVHFEQVQNKVSAKYDQWQREILFKFGSKLGHSMTEFHAAINNARFDLEKFSVESSSTADIITFIIFLQDLKRRVVGWTNVLESLSSGQKILERQRFSFPSNWIYFEQIEGEWGAFNEIFLKKEKLIQDQMPDLQRKIVNQDKVVQLRLAQFLEDWNKSKPTQGNLKPDDALSTLSIFAIKFSALRDEILHLNKAKDALDLMKSDHDMNAVSTSLEEIDDLNSVWMSLSKVWNEIDLLRGTPWTNVVPRKIRSVLESLLASIKDMPVKVRQYSAFEHLSDYIKALVKVNSVVGDLKSEALRERHWNMLIKRLNVTMFLADITLGYIWALDLKKNEPIIRDVITIAQGEMALEEFLRLVKDKWTSYPLDLVNFQSKCRLIKGWDDLLAACSEHLNSLHAMSASPYYREFEEEAKAWEDKLNRIQLLFDVWIDVQRQWVYLEGVFMGNADIKHLLPVESNRFQNINTEFMALMKKVYKSPLVLDVLNIAGVQKSMERLAELLLKIQKALGDYLERERTAFPRFFFVGDEDLLEIIGNAKDVPRVAKHFKKMFSGINDVVLNEAGNITGICSRDAEKIALKNHISVSERKINEWLSDLELEMKLSLAEELKNCTASFFAVFQDVEKSKFLSWVEQFPMQLVVVAAQIVWTSFIEKSLSAGDTPTFVLHQIDLILSILADSVICDLSRNTRRKCEHLITEMVHQRDVARSLVEHEVNSKISFEWLYHLRYYFDPQTRDPLRSLEVKMANASFFYGFEYLGTTDRLVQTPLTDRCFLSLTQALQSRLGGSPFGPAGTGKTESVKALGVALGRFVLVSCCDENFDFQAMGRIFVGLCMVGAWGCFDEFNRLEERILSAVSQQIQSIQTGLRKLSQGDELNSSVEVELLGRTMPVSPNTGIFITMNPGYAGRSNLPDNLKRLFRSVAMTRPDRQKIAEVMLYSQGFTRAELLASKIVPFFNLCSEQLSSQSHYDFGLRALKSVLTSAGNLKRKSNGTSDVASSSNDEIQILIEAVRENILPKLVAEDIPLLVTLLHDVFPGSKPKETDLNKLTEEISKVCNELHLECTPLWMEKIVQLYRIQENNHGLMLVGPSGTGKTTNWNVLVRALERVENVEGVTYVIDPKAIPKDKLYGTLDSTTREWNDGLFTYILRKIIDNLRGESTKRHWIIFDGDVDPEWVENLNSVLDDNKILTLPNGERLALPQNVRIVFEVEDLKYATLATVSRCGMVWYSNDIVTNEMLCLHYVNKMIHGKLEVGEDILGLGDDHISQVKELVGKFLLHLLTSENFIWKALQYAETEVVHVMEFTCSRALNSFFSLLNKSLLIVLKYDAEHPDFPLSQGIIEAYFTRKTLLSMMWSFSGDSKSDSRQKFSDYISKLIPVDLPPNFKNLSDYDVTLPEGDWVSWAAQVPQIEIETQNVSQADVVIPTMDTIRLEDVLYSWISDHKPVLLCGPPGSGKTMSLFTALRKLPEVEVVGVNFSAATSPEVLLKSLEQYCEYRKSSSGITLSPAISGKWVVVFCDEINLPAPDNYGTQKVITFLRQLIEKNGFWRTSDLQWIKIEHIQFVGACNPPTDPGRVPLSHRLLCHTPLIMVDYPGRSSLVQIYSTFSRALLKVIPSLRGYAEALTNAMVDFYLESQLHFTTDSQSHYVYSPRELTRWVRGIFEAIYPLDDLTLDGLVRVWAHEGLRLFRDRLVSEEEREWTDKALDKVAHKHFPVLDPKSLCRPMLFSNWLTKNYVSVDRAALREFLKARLRVFYEEELDVPLVLFNHVLEHVLRIDRVFRQMQGHLLLIGISGSGKTTLTRFVAWMNGFSVFQIKSHNKYTSQDFDDDLRSVLRRAGCKGEKICFIMDESNVLSSAFLERMNTLLANAEIPGLFEGDEHITLMNQCKEAASKEGLLFDSPDELYKWFTRQIMKNLHIVFTMNPPDSGLASRAATSPALFNRCVLNWMGDWNDEAFFQVAKEFTDVLDLEILKYKAPDTIPIHVRELPLPPSYREAVLNVFVGIHFSVNDMNKKLLKRQGRYNYCTPRHYLDFISHYVKLFREKREELEDQQRHINVGLDKLNDTVQQVEDLRISLAQKKLELETKNQQANDKLVKMVAEQQEAEQKKLVSQQISQALELQNREVEDRKLVVMGELSRVEPIVREAQKSVSGIKKQQLTEVRSMGNPPEAVKLTMESVCTILGHQIDSWKAVQTVIRRDDFIASIVNFDTEKSMKSSLRERMKRDYLSNPTFNFDIVNRASKACGPLVQWVIAQLSYSEILDRVGPLREEVKSLEQSAEETQVKASEIEGTIAHLERSIQNYKEEYAVLISATQLLKSEMERVKCKVDRSLSLITSLGIEKQRWSRTSSSFETQMTTLIGDTVLHAAFLAYSGFFDQQYRHALWMQWRNQLQCSDIQFKNELSLIENLCSADKRLTWHSSTLPKDDLCVENAIMIERHNRFPLVIDPSGQAISFLQNQYRDKKIVSTSFLDDSFLKNLESALRFGSPILVQDAEHLDPIINPILNKELRRTGGRVLIRLGNQDIDFSPSFSLFLVTRDQCVHFPPDVCSRVTFVNFTVTKSSLQAQCLNKLLSQERPDVEKKRTDLLKLQGEFGFKLRHLEKSLLKALSDSTGNILDDDQVIDTLEVLKKEAGEVERMVSETNTVMTEVENVTTIYTPLAACCASIFIALEQMSHIHHFYQFSLGFFIDLFNFVLAENSLASIRDPQERLNALTFRLFEECYRRVRFSLLNEDQVLFSLILSRLYLKLISPSLIESAEYEFLFSEAVLPVGAPNVDTPGVQNRLNLVAKLPAFRLSLVDHFDSNASDWNSFLCLKSNLVPECWMPNENPLLVQVYRSVVTKAFRPDLLWSEIERLIGLIFSNALQSTLDLPHIVQFELSAHTPLMLCSQPGYDASYKVESLAQERKCNFHSVAMGSPEGYSLAEKAITNALQNGSWVLLKNVHLSPQWLSHLEKRLHSIRPPTGFRLFLTSETNPSVPINLIRQSRILLFESRPGIKANLLESLNSIHRSSALSDGPMEKNRLFFLVSWVHAIFKERLKYLPIGWSKFYEFNDADLECATLAIQKWCEMIAGGRANISPDKIPWNALKTLLIENVYGGKIDEEYDQQILASFIENLFVPQTFNLNFPLHSDGLSIPEGTRLEQFIEWTRALPDREPPTWLGLPKNAENVMLAVASRKLITKLHKLRSLEDDQGDMADADKSPNVFGSSNPSFPAWMTSLLGSVNNWLSSLPSSLNEFAHPIVTDPLNRFFHREHVTANNFYRKLVNDLNLVKLSCEGKLKQTNHIRSLMASLNKGIVPKEWVTYRYPKGFQIHQWMLDLVKRLDQVNVFAKKSHFNMESIWIGGLFFPEAFITATRQFYAQELKVSLEELEIALDLTEKPKQGLQIVNMRLECGEWRDNSLHLSGNLSQSLRLVSLKWHIKTQQAIPVNNLVDVPVYLNEDRITYLFKIPLPSSASSNTIKQSGLALMAS